MANFVFNIAKGRVAEFFERVNANEPSTSCLVLVPLSQSGSAAQGQDLDTLSAVEADANFAEQKEGNWERKLLKDADLPAVAADDSEDRMEISIPEVKWTTGPTAGKNTTGLLICYDPKEGEGADTEIIPLVHLDFAVTADGNEVIINPGEVFRAT